MADNLDAVYSRSMRGGEARQAGNDLLYRNGLDENLQPIQGTVTEEPLSQPDAASRSAGKIAQQKLLMRQESAQAPSFMRDVVAGTGKELVRGVVGGVQDASKELLQSADSLAKWFGQVTGTKSGGAFGKMAEGVPQLVGESETPGGKLLRGVSQFATGYAAGGKVVKGAGKGAALLKGAFSDVAAFDPNDPNISNMINEMAPGLANPISEFLATNPGDNEAVNRLKRAAEGAGLGVATDGILAVLRNLRARKAITAAVPEAAAPKPTSAAVQPTPGKTAGDIAENALREEQAASILYTSGKESPEVSAEVMSRGRAFLQEQALSQDMRAAQEATLAETGNEIAANLVKEAKPELSAILKSQKGEISPDTLHTLARAAVGGALGLTQGDTMEERITNAVIAAGAGAALKPSLIKKLIPAMERIAPKEIKVARSFDAGPQPKVKPVGPVTVASETAAKEFLAADPSAIKVGDKAIKINWSEIGSPEQIDDTIRTLTKLNESSIDVARRGVQSDTRRQQLAQLLGVSEDDMLRRRKGQALNSEQTQAYIDVYGSAVNELDRLATAMKAGEPVENQFRLHLGRTTALTDSIFGARAEAGRSLRVWGQSAQPIQRPGGAALQAMELGGKTLDEIPAEKLADMVLKLNSPAQKATFLQDASKIPGAVLEGWINGLLSNPVTHAANIVSNALTTGVGVAERALAPWVGKDIVRGEASAMISGISGGWSDALTLAKKAFQQGESQLGFSKVEMRPRQISAENFNLTGPIGRAVDLLGAGVSVPTRALTAADDFFKAINYRAELHAQAFRQAASEGLTGPALQSRYAALAGDVDFKSLVKDQAEGFAAYQTFNQQLGEFGSGYINWIDKHPWARFITPFVRTPVNIAKYTLERTPLVNLAMDSVKADLAAGGSRRQMALAKTAFGGMTYATAATLALGGFITGGGPLDPDLKAIKRQTGWQPYSVKIGDTYISFKRTDPIGFVLGLAADMVEKIGELNDLDAGSLGMAGVVAFKDTFMDKTYLEGLQNVFEAINDKNGKLIESYFSRLAGSFVPAGLAQIARIMDPTIKEINGAADAIYSRLPGFSESVPARRNLWGEKITLEGALGPDMVSPFYTSTGKDDPVSNEMLRLEMSTNVPSNYIYGTRPTDSPFAKDDPRRGVRLLPEEYARYQELAGQPAHEKLMETIKSDAYLRMSDFDKKTIIGRYMEIYRKQAEAKIIEEFPDLKEEIVLKNQERIQSHMPVSP